MNTAHLRFLSSVKDLNLSFCLECLFKSVWQAGGKFDQKEKKKKLKNKKAYLAFYTVLCWVLQHLVGEHGAQSLQILICSTNQMVLCSERGEKGFPKTFTSIDSGYSDSENNFKCQKYLDFSEILLTLLLFVVAFYSHPLSRLAE